MTYSQRWITKILLARSLSILQNLTLIFAVLSACAAVFCRFEQKANTSHMFLWMALGSFWIFTGCGFAVPFVARGRLDWLLFWRSKPLDWRSSEGSRRVETDGVRANEASQS